MGNKWRKFWQLSFAEQRLLAQSALLLPLIAVALKTIGLRRLQRILFKLSPKPMSLAESSNRVRQSSAMVICAANNLSVAHCLTRSLTLWWLLRRQGIASDLRVGVRKVDGQFQAHAWIEYQGCVVNDTADVAERYSPFAESLNLEGGDLVLGD